MCVKLNSIDDSEIRYIMLHKCESNVSTSKRCVQTTYSNLETRILGAWANIESVIEIMSVKWLVIVTIVFKRYPSAYCLMQFNCFICSDFKKLNI